MQSIDMLVDTSREFLHQIAAFLPRLVLALAVVLVGWLLAKTVRFAVEKGLRAVNLIIAFNGLGATYITDLLQRAELFTPKVLVAMLVVVLGSYFARFVGEAIHTYCTDAQIPDADILGKIARYLIMTFVVMIALSQVEVGGDIVQRTFLIILFGLVLALALAFGIGGKDWAAAMLERWWPQRKKDDHRGL